jgi:AbrB family looped-hinge helix DNA binding protein
MTAMMGKVGKRGTVVIPAPLRHRFGLEEGSLAIPEARGDGVLIRPAIAMPVEIYTPERRAEFLLSNAVDEKDYARAVEEVRRLALDPDSIPHSKPGKALKIQEQLQDYEDLRSLREAKEAEKDAPTIGIDELKKKIGTRTSGARRRTKTRG